MQRSIQSVTSREFARNLSEAKRSARTNGTVLITDRGKPAFVLLAIGEYRRLTAGEPAGGSGVGSALARLGRAIGITEPEAQALARLGASAAAEGEGAS